MRDDLLIRRGSYWHVPLADPDSTGFLKARNTGIPSTGYQYQPKILDMNGDGRGDLVYRGSNNNWHFRLLDAGFGAASDTGLSTLRGHSREYALVVDINGDGLRDLLIPYGSYYQGYLSTGAGFRREYTTLSGSGYQTARALDLNGDGLTDILFRVGSRVQYALNNSGQFTARAPIPAR